MPTVSTVTVDVEGAVRDWVNTLTDTLVGAGQPIPLGAHLKRLRSPSKQAYVLLSRVGGGDEWGGHADDARISASIYAMTKEAAAAGAVAYANHVRALGVLQPVVGAVRLRACDNVTGPTYIPDGDEERYLVDADIFTIPA